ncbi:MAG: hemerythrin domain-containing protein [Desulfobacterales bacterium]
MLSEHEKGHKLSLQLKKLVASYQSGDEQAATGIRQTIKNYVELLERHFAKENKALFPMAKTKLDANRDNALFADLSAMNAKASVPESMRRLIPCRVNCRVRILKSERRWNERGFRTEAPK